MRVLMWHGPQFLCLLCVKDFFQIFCYTEVVFVKRTNIHKHYRKTYHVIISRLEATELFLILISEMRVSNQLSIIG